MSTFSLASFNAHYGVLAKRGTSRSSYDVGEVLGCLDADVIVVQEVWRPDGETGPIDAAAEQLGLTMVHEPLGRATMVARWPHPTTRAGEGTYGVAVLTRRPVRRIGAVPVGPTRLDPAPSRTVLHVEIDVDGTPVQLFAAHLTSRLPHGPVQQLRALARQLPPPGAPVVVAGDCNFWALGVRMLVRGWHNAVRGATWPAAHPHSQIDHVLVRRRDVDVLAGEVLGDVGSDHRPVRAELRVPPDRGEGD